MPPLTTAQQLNDLEAHLAENRLPQEIPDAESLGYLFRLAMIRALRTGPSGPAPARILTVANKAVIERKIPLEIPAGLRRLCDDALATMRRADAWAPDAPAWWEPLPGPSDLEMVWNRSALPFHDATVLKGAFSDGSSCFLSMPLLDREHTATIYRELEHAATSGRLPLERAGVGDGDQIKDVRTDESCYLTGTEEGLAAIAPNLTALIRRLLTQAARSLAPSTNGPIYPPQSVMLARYRGPTEGYRPHVDNPGGPKSNGRVRTLTLYLSDPDQRPEGGDLAVWRPHTRADREPDRVIATDPGSACLFDARAVPHQVLPLKRGARWALVVWFNEQPQQPPRPVPAPNIDELLVPIERPPLPPGRILFHELERNGGGRISVWQPTKQPRVGLVCTVYGAGAFLEHWCNHHLNAGIDHLILVFDHLEEAGETALADRLATTFPPKNLTIFSGRDLRRDKLHRLPDDPRLAGPRRIAESGNSSYAVASRQMLHASCILAAARTDALGGAPLDWLVHLDADELLMPLGPGRGGETLADCLAAADEAGYPRLRFANHELLTQAGYRPCFKMNPHQAAARLGATGWQQVVKHLNLSQEGPRPWFLGYFNGKSAVRVAAGYLAAGVHGWYLNREAPDTFIAGPVVLHCHIDKPDDFSRKYLRKAADPVPEESRLFHPSPVEEAAMRIIGRAEAEGLSKSQTEKQLADLFHQLTDYTAREREMLTEAGLFIPADFMHPIFPDDHDIIPK
ncbi:MAG: 2OG-Fe(II) oxygenase [Acidobacteriota bacterium]|nr:2OG-Fe(II) oxygenase [Acidobacteriota bacterium]